MNNNSYAELVQGLMPTFRRIYIRESSKQNHTAEGWDEFVSELYQQVNVVMQREYKNPFDINSPSIQFQISDAAKNLAVTLNESKERGQHAAMLALNGKETSAVKAAARDVGGFLGPMWGAAPIRRKESLSRAYSDRSVDRQVSAYTRHLMDTRIMFLGNNEIRTIFNEALTNAVSETLPSWTFQGLIQAHPCCKICAEVSHVQIPLDQTWELTTGSFVAPPFHMNCILGDTNVSATGITATTERVFHGDVITFRTSLGYSLSCTPHHPILTDFGWLFAGDLHEGSNVVSSVDSKWMININNDNSDVIPTIKQISESFLRSGKVMTTEMPTSSEDFHGDGINGEITVVRSDSKLWYDNEASLLQHLLQFNFGDAGMSFCDLSSSSLSEKFFVAGDSVSPGFISSGSNNFSILDRSSTHPEESGVGLSTDSYLGAKKLFSDSSTADGQILSNRLFALTGRVSLDKVVSVERVHRTVPVYNLEADSGWYIANGIITHNCKCFVKVYKEK